MREAWEKMRRAWEGETGVKNGSGKYEWKWGEKGDKLQGYHTSTEQ